MSIVLFTLGTLLCAPIAKTFTVFFVGRSVQGIGGGGIITLGQVIFADFVPLRQRPKYFALVQISWALGSVLGPLIGGLFVEHATWAWCFYINVRTVAFVFHGTLADHAFTAPILRLGPCPRPDICQAQNRLDIRGLQNRACRLDRRISLHRRLDQFPRWHLMGWCSV